MWRHWRVFNGDALNARVLSSSCPLSTLPNQLEGSSSVFLSNIFM